jgi:spermidine synthase
VVSQGESPFYNPAMQKKLFSILKSNFKIVSYLNFSNLTYPGGLWSFSYASNDLDPVKDFKAHSVKKSGLTFNYYNQDLHPALFCLPEFQRRNLGIV